MELEPEFGERFSFKAFADVRLIVSSRVFGVVRDKIKTDALVPLADMLNHRLPKQTSWYYCEKSKGFVIRAMKDIEKGS